MNLQEAMASYALDAARFETLGVFTPGVRAYVTPELKRNYLAMDAQPELMTAPNSGIPSWLTTLIDPAIYEILFAPSKAAEILGEQRKGSWLDQTAMFPTVEHTVEVSSYGDFNENGRASANTNWPQRQSYLFQIMMEYGEREIEMAGLGRVNWVSELESAAALGLTKFANLSYFFGVAGLQNYGLLNDPGLGAPLSPAPKAAGGTTWFTADGAPNATANEVYNDIVAIFAQLVTQNAGLVDKQTKMTLAMSPGSEVALTFTNTFAVNVEDLLKKNFPNMRVVSAVQYGELSADNPQGIAGGNMVQLIAESIEGQKTGFCAFNEKLRAHAIVKATSSFKQKKTAGTWGAVIRMPVGFASMLGV